MNGSSEKEVPERSNKVAEDAFQMGKFDSMLEILPDELDGHIFSGWGSGKSDSQVFEDGVEQMNTNDGSTSLTQPIDIVKPSNASSYLNLQNGEIDHLWDFNVDEFMMTPSEHSSEGATISQPNSLTMDATGGLSEQPNMNSVEWDGLQPMVPNASAPFDNDFQFLRHSIFSNTLSALGQLHKGEEDTNSIARAGTGISGGSRPQAVPKRSALLQKGSTVWEDGHIPLSSQATNNSVKKNQISRQLSTTSLTSYRKGTQANNAIVEAPSKPLVQCFNCKTYKTPLWRRDPQGNTLCNACGLFQKLHGTMRPLSLKSDVIKKRNTKKRGPKKTEQDGQQKQGTIKSQAPGPAKRMSNSYSRGISNKEHTLPQNKQYQTNSIAKSPPAVRKVPRIISNYESEHNSGGIGHLHQTHGSPTEYSNAPALASDITYESLRLDSNNLMHHNRNMSSSGHTHPMKKSRRSSSSSANTCSSKSSARQVVPILPKPSPTELSASGNPNSTPNFSSYGTLNPAGTINSTTSSPRYLNSPRAGNGGNGHMGSSPVPSAGLLSTSAGTGPSSISIPRRKSSKASVSQSLSFMAHSLQQLQSQNNTLNGSSSMSATPMAWNPSASSPKVVTNSKPQRTKFDLFSPSQQSQEPARATSMKSQTSLLSQQLQQSSAKVDFQHIPSQVQHSQNSSYTVPAVNAGTSIPAPPSALRKNSITSSPRNSYTASLQQQRGILQCEQQRRSSTLSLRNVEGASAPNQGNAMNERETNTQGDDKTSDQSNIMVDLDWLKFGL